MSTIEIILAFLVLLLVGSIVIVLVIVAASLTFMEQLPDEDNTDEGEGTR